MTDEEKIKFLRKMGYGSGQEFTKPTSLAKVLDSDLSANDTRTVIDLKTGKKTTQKLREGKEKKDTRVEISDLRMLARIFDVKKAPEVQKSFDDELKDIESGKV